jgi:hypothetical protein
MHNSTWACFDCREAVRRPDYTVEEIHCPTCNEKMSYLGDRVRIPAKRQAKAWRKLWETVQNTIKGKEWQRDWHIKRLASQLEKLEASPRGSGVRKK